MTVGDPSSYAAFYRDREQWTAAITADKTLSASAIAVAQALLRHTSRERWIVWPSVETLMRRTNRSRRTVQCATKQLAARGYIAIGSQTGRGNTNTYEIIPPDRAALSAKHPCALKEEIKAQIASSKGRNAASEKGAARRAQNTNTTTPLIGTPAQSQGDLFEIIWSAAPPGSCARSSREKVRAAVASLGPSPDIDAILKGLREWNLSSGWHGPLHIFISDRTYEKFQPRRAPPAYLG